MVLELSFVVIILSILKLYFEELQGSSEIRNGQIFGLREVSLPSQAISSAECVLECDLLTCGNCEGKGTSQTPLASV